MSAQDLRRQTIRVGELALGMFVAELDRPWLDSPFLLQGFVLESEKELKQIQQLCRTVVIDRTMSTGEHFAAEAKLDISANTIPRQRSTPAAGFSNTIRPSSSAPEKFSFFDVLRDLNAARQPALGTGKQQAAATADAPSRQAQPASERNASIPASAPAAANAADAATPLTLSEHIRQDLSNVFGSLSGWLPKARKSKSADTTVSMDTNTISTSPLVDDRIPVEEEIAVIYPEFAKAQLATREIFEAIASEQKIDLLHVNQTIDNMADSIERNPDALMWLTRLKQQDDYAYNHAFNVSVNLMAFAHFMALPKPQIKELGLAGLLQDVGKIKIPSELLQKEDRLSEQEFVTMKSHVHIGLDMLRDSENVSPKVLEIIANHHERIDGAGYPGQLKQGQISMAAQMAGLMDTYCALTTDKPYAKGIFNQQALETLYASADKQYSAALINQLIQFFGIYPVSSLVELNSGEVAVVIQQNRIRRLQPRVMVLLNADKSKNAHPATLDLIHMPLNPQGEPYQIVRGLPANSHGLNPADFYL